jgi:alkanesulfonate monooxygenase SsuD/methylene tetrahydromethanopterin reductase-like flavin-dependent oxidoreductase (luciferase family)
MFGVDVTTSAAPGADPVGQARRAESLGFDFVSANDHPCGTAPSYEVWTMLAWIAAATRKIKVATRVLGVPYRSPAMVAKMAESFDRLSGERLILGLGGGYSDDEFRAFGLRVPSPKEKVEGLEEAIRIARGLWSEKAFTFEGRHHRVVAADVEPKPGRRIPIWLGTFGKRALDVTGWLADGWIPTLSVAPPDVIPQMRDRVFAAAREAGRDPSELTLAYNVEVRVGDRSDAPTVLAGEPDAIADRLLGFVALGFSAFNLSVSGPAPAEQLERLAREVVPAVRGAA